MEDRLQPEEQIDYDGVKDLLEYFLNDEEPVVKENGHVKCREEFGKEDEERSYGGGDDREEEVDSDGRRGDVSIVEGFNDDGSEGEDEGGEEVKEPFDVKDDDDDEIRKRAELLALPPHGSEIFIGGLPRDASEEDLRELANPFGDIFEVTVIKDKDTKESKGCAFVMFTSSDAAQKAIEGIHEKIFEGRTLRCNFSQAKHRLFVGNVPRSLMEEEVWRILQETGPGVQHIEMFKDPHNQTRNRGFLFVEFYNHACAEYTRQKMIDPNFKIDETNPVVNWANSSAADQVKAIYVKNLPDNVSSGRLKKLFEQNGEVTMVVFPPAKFGQGKQDFGFVHFAERHSALKAVKYTEKYEIDGHILEVSLAKPQVYKRNYHSTKPWCTPRFPPYPHSFPRDPYGAYGEWCASAGFGQQTIYGRGPKPAGMIMASMVLPDGRLGYVLQKPDAPPTGPSYQAAVRNGASNKGISRGNDGYCHRRCRRSPY